MEREQVVSINRKWCKGCGICVEFCPKRVLSMDRDGKATVSDIDKCTRCGMCELRCPDFAVTIRRT